MEIKQTLPLLIPHRTMGSSVEKQNNMQMLLRKVSEVR